MKQSLLMLAAAALSLPVAIAKGDLLVKDSESALRLFNSMQRVTASRIQMSHVEIKSLAEREIKDRSSFLKKHPASHLVYYVEKKNDDFTCVVEGELLLGSYDDVGSHGSYVAGAEPPCWGSSVTANVSYKGVCYSNP